MQQQQQRRDPFQMMMSMDDDDFFGGGFGGGGGFTSFQSSSFGGFGGGMGGGGRKLRGRSKQKMKVKPIARQIEVTLADIYNGKKIDLNVERQRLCPACNGIGGTDKSAVQTCPDCKGQGFRTILRQMGPGMYSQSKLEAEARATRAAAPARSLTWLRGAKSARVRRSRNPT